jgi:hypothetical protein
VNAGKSGVISRHIPSLCGEARDATYTRDADLKMWAAQPGKCRCVSLGVISRHISSLCGEARDATYTRDADLKMWAAQPVSADVCR